MGDEAKKREFPANTVHVIRTAQQIHVMLSQMADQKANMLLAATFVIFTIAIGQVRDMAEPLPLLILGGAAFFSAIFAVLAVLPMTKGKRTSSRPNLLFFGTFSQMEEEAFIDEVTARLRTEDSIYRTMARDIYQGGCVLQGRKYRMLTWAYRLFLLGLVASCAAFVIQQFL